MMEINIKRENTAIRRNKLSVPFKFLLKNNLLNGTVLDYGCGRGDNFEELRNNYKINISGYDKFQPEWSEKPNNHFNIITCNYVLNVIEDPMERFELIEELKTMGDQVYITVRSDIKSIKDNWIPYNDGYLTGRKNNCTFQKIYTIDMVKDEFGNVKIIMANSTGIMFKV